MIDLESVTCKEESGNGSIGLFLIGEGSALMTCLQSFEKVSRAIDREHSLLVAQGHYFPV